MNFVDTAGFHVFPRLEHALRRINVLRASAMNVPTMELAATEAILDDLFDCGRYLAVYGSLAPGERHHDLLAQVPGEWTHGTVHGRLHNAGWAKGRGYPALTWDPRGAPVSVQLLRSEHLARHWARLDAFEGAGYLRILVPVWLPGDRVVVANLYALRSVHHADCL